jgi:mRNA interferase MazF
MVDLNPTKGHEQSGRRPALILSVDMFNHGPAGLAVVLPITGQAKGVPFHVRVTPPEGGLDLESYIKCEDIRSISRERLGRRMGTVSPPTLQAVEDRIRILLSL